MKYPNWETYTEWLDRVTLEVNSDIDAGTGSNEQKQNAVKQELRLDTHNGKNPSLTIDELVQLDGESVWCLDGEGHQCWCLVNAEYDECMDNGGGSWQFEHYGMAGDGVMGLQGMGWTAYRYKVED
jgi:hypothetical protein